MNFQIYYFEKTTKSFYLQLLIEKYILMIERYAWFLTSEIKWMCQLKFG